MWKDEMFSEIQKGDKVGYETPQGQTFTAKAVMQGPHGWVCDRGQGQPVVVNEGSNYLGHSKGRNRQPDYLGKFLHG